MKRRAWWFLLWCGLLAGIAAAQDNSLAQWELHDSLGHSWSGELLYYDLTLKRPVAPAQPLALFDETGQAVPVQVVERRTDAQGRTIGVRIALLTDLAPFQQRRFRLLAATPKSAPTDLAVTKDGTRWILRTSKLGLAIPLGAGRDVAAFADAPPPILALRGAGNTWAGKGWLTGTRRVVSWRSEVLADGPVFAWARVSYDFGDGKSYVVDIRVPAGQPVALLREERNLPDATTYETDPARGYIFQLALAANLNPTHVYSKRGLGSRGYFGETGPEFPGAYLTPAQLHFLPAACNIVGTWREGGPDATFIGLFPRFLSHWNRPHDTAIPLVWDKTNGLTARFFLNAGVREWGLMAGPRDAMIKPRGTGGEGQLTGYFDALLLNNKWGETPLDKVKDWTLDWGAARYQAGSKYAVASRERGTMPYFAEQFLLGGQKWEDTYIHVQQTWTGEGDAWARYTQTVAALPPEQVLNARAAAAFVMYKQNDPDYWPAANWIGPSNPNMKMMGYAAITLGALELSGHPQASAWLDTGLRALRQSLSEAASADGAWLESPGYDGAGLQPILRAALSLQRHGRDDLAADGKLLKVALAHVYLMTPPDPRVNNLRHLPEFGDSFDLAADPTALRVRPVYWKEWALLLQSKYPREAGNILWALGEKDGALPWDGKSRQLAGFGAAYRHAYNTPQESYLAVHQDSFSFGHYHFDLGALYLFGLGVPLAVDWPSLYAPQISPAWRHNGVSVARLERFAYEGRVSHSVITPVADYSRARVYYDEAFPPPAGNEADATTVPQHCWQRQVIFVKKTDGTAYVVVRDAVTDERPTEWNLWTLSDKLRLSRMRADVNGIYGVNLAINFFAGPEQTPLTETFGFGALPAGVAAGGENRRSEPAPGVALVTVPHRNLMQQNAVRMVSAQGGEYGAVLFPYRATGPPPVIAAGPDGTVTVTSGGVTDTIFVYPTERTVTLGDISFRGRAGIVSRRNGLVEARLLEGTALNVKGAARAGNAP